MANQSAPGKYYRKGITLLDAVNRFGDPEQAEQWFVEQRWRLTALPARLAPAMP